MAAELNRIRAWGKRNVKQERTKRDTRLAGIKQDAVDAKAAVTLNTAPGDTTAQAKLDSIIASVNAVPGADKETVVSGPNLGPILTQLNTAKTQIALVTAGGDTAAQTALTNARTLLQAIKSENIAAPTAKIDSAKANVTLNTTPADAAAQADIDSAISLINAFV